MLRRIRRPHAILALALATLAGACGSDSSTGPKAQPVTLDQALSEISSPALSAAAASFDGGLPTLPTLAASRCPYQAVSQSFACAPLVVSGLTVTQSFTLLDGSGTPQPAFDQATTSAVRANTAFEGRVPSGTDSVAIDGQQQITLSGLREAIHTLDGTSTVHIVGIGTDVPFETTVSTTITGLKLQPPTADGTHPWPKAGTIVVQSAISLGNVPPATVRATITFNGTSKVAVTITGPGVSTSCTIDLASQAPSCN
ncbi:MAG: hypothetical protein JF589_17725 [Gemmatimonadetes bacterium]|nr:hypothetical protein [Gemmatimonadota bacterium]